MKRWNDANSTPIFFWFAAAAFSRSLVWCFSDMLLAFHAHKALDLGGERTGQILAMTAGAGAAGDLILGWLMTRWRVRGRKALAWQRYGIIACGVPFALQFLPVHDARWLVGWSILFRIAFEAAAVPQAMLMAWLPVEADGVRHLVTLNAALGAVARVVMAGFTFVLLGQSRILFEATEALLAGLVALAAIFAAHRLAEAGRDRTEGVAAPSEVDLSQAGPILPTGFVALSLGITLHAAILYLLARLLIFTPGPDGVLSPAPVLLLLLTVGMIVGPVVMDRLPALRAERGFAWTMVLLAGAATALLWLPIQPMLRIVAACLYGAALSASATLLWQALAERIRRSGDSDRHGGGMAFSLFAFAAKAGMVAGGWLTGQMLDGFTASDTGTLIEITILISGGALVCVGAWRTLPRRPHPIATRRLQQEEVIV